MALVKQTQRETTHQPPKAMTVLELSFPTGRFHATPWGRHVNEGAVEWPPSPWRILRAVIATWHLKAKDDIAEPLVRSLVEKLSTPPSFRLPRASASHTRHYMPLGNEKTTKVFDTFIQLEEGSTILIAWEVALTDDERTALKKLAERLGYFGRAESLAIARVLDGVTGIEANAIPLKGGATPPPRTELVRLLAPMAPQKYQTWRSAFLAASPVAAVGKKKPGKKAKSAEAEEDSRVPRDLFSALHADTGDLQAAGWNLPPGAQFVDYTRAEKPFAPATRPRPQRRGKRSTVARFALTSVVPPSIIKALAVGEQIHDILCSARYTDGHPTFTGAGRKDHEHAHIFCESLGDNVGHVTHITIYAPEGFDEVVQTALRKLNWAPGFKDHELRTVLHGLGTPGDFSACPLFATAARWRSHTPFVSTRHGKTFRGGTIKLDANNLQPGSAKHDLLRLLKKHRPEAFARIRDIHADVRELSEKEMPYRFENRSFRSLQFQTRRHKGEGRRGNGSGSAFEITFTEPVTGPFALGYGAHFGLGLFLPVDGA
jgi:CRISPR-associated protein Csb2